MTVALRVEPPPEDPDLPFPSLSALREAHIALLERRGESDAPPELPQEIEDFLRRGRATGALLDAGSERRVAQSLLDYWANLLYRLDRRVVAADLDEFDPKLAPNLDDADCPYVGLNAFREEDHGRFFGRQGLVEQMVARLAQQRLLVVVGPSGSGKSSLVLGGLLPRLKTGALPGSETWHYLPRLVPGSDPFRNLAAAMLPPSTGSAEIGRLAVRLAQDPAVLAELAAGDRPWVVVIDQFEEIFTLSRNEEVNQAFAQSLRSLVEPSGSRHIVLLTLRSDYETQVARLEALQPLFARAQARVPPLSAVELREVIEKPAELVGLKFEEGLVDKLIYDLLGDPAGLPLLQFTLLKLWEQRDHNRVTWAAYRELGSGREALARSARKFFEEKLSPEERVTARRILLRMVRPSASLEVTSNRVPREMLYEMEDPGRVERVLEKLVKARLVRLTVGETPADIQVEIAHEALVRNWLELVEWLDEERAQMVLRDRWEAQAAEWARLGRGEGGLMDGVQLFEVERWLQSADADRLGCSPELRELVDASRGAIERRKAEEEAAQQQKTTRLRLYVALLAGLLIVTVGASIIAIRKQEDFRSEQERFSDHVLGEQRKLFRLRQQKMIKNVEDALALWADERTQKEEALARVRALQIELGKEKKQKEQARTKAGEWEATANKLQIERDTEKDQKEQARTKAGEWEATANKLQTERDTERDQKEQARKEAGEWEAAASKLQTERNAEKDQKEQARKEAGDLQKNLDTEKAEKNKALAELKAALKHVSDLQTQVTVLKLRFAELEQSPAEEVPSPPPPQ